ncbi:MAG: ATP-binding protein [Phycisphaerales bacterium]
MAKRDKARMIARESSPIGCDGGASPRPTLLGDVIGHEGPKLALHRAMSGGRVHHAWIFHGPPGVGKFTTAYAMAAALLDPTTAPGLTGEFVPQHESPVQRLCRAGTHPDLHVIGKELASLSREDSVRRSKQNNIAREVLLEFLIEPASRTRVLPGESLMGKAFIIDEAELLDVRGQNTLLKILEEPTAGTIIILVTANEDRLLPTIRSRSQRLAFGPLSDGEMDQWFARQGITLDPARRAWTRSFAAGSPGMAAMAIACDLHAWHEQLTPIMEALGRGAFPPEAGATLARLVNERAEADVKAKPDASKDGANKAWGRRMLAFLAEWQRSSLRATTSSSRASASADTQTARALSAIEAIRAAEDHLAANVNMTLLFENLVAQLALEPEV